MVVAQAQICITISNEISKIKIFDSYQLLLSSLRKLAIAFDCEVQKGVFPFKFLNENQFIVRAHNYKYRCLYRIPYKY